MKAVVALSVVALLAARAQADPALPDAMRAKLEQMAPLHGTSLYVPPVGKIPARWLAFIGGDVATSAWVITPGAGRRELVRINEWPTAVRVAGAIMGLVPDGMPGDHTAPHAFVIVESLAAVELDQPAGLRSIVIIDLPEPKYEAMTSHYAESLPWVAGVADERDIAPRIADAAKHWDENVTKLMADESGRPKLFDRAAKSTRELAKLIPRGGIAVLDTWQATFAREAGRVSKLGGGAPERILRDAIAAVQSCSGKDCGSLLLGVESDRLVIRAVLSPRMPERRHGARRAIAASTKDTQTSAAARALAVKGAFVGEAPLSAAGGTIGVVDSGSELAVVESHGPYIALRATWPAPATFQFADLDGDGLTDVVFHMPDRGAEYVFGGPGGDPGFGMVPALDLAALGRTSLDDIVAAVLAVPSQPVTKRQACALLAGATSSARLDRAMAPGGQIILFEEPARPGQGRHDVVTGAQRINELQRVRKRCDLVCEPAMPTCYDRGEGGPDGDFYLFSRIGGKLRLAAAALYRGA